MEQALDWLYDILAILFVFFALGFCVFSHELGHFLAARLLGLHVDAFSLGFRPFWRKKVNGVEYRLGYLPFGGYVELPQIDASDGEPKSASGEKLRRATPRERIITAAAGPFFNILSGFLIGGIVWFCGLPQDTPKMREIPVRAVALHSPEYEAGLRQGDVITRLNGETFNLTWAKFVEKILYCVGKVSLEVRRGDETLTVVYIPKENPGAPGSIGREKVAYPFFYPVVPLQVFPEKGSIAQRAGIRAGDVVLTAGGAPVTDYFELQQALNLACGSGEALKLELQRGKETLSVSLHPEPFPGLENQSRYLIGITMGDAPSGGVVIHALVPGGSAAKAGILPQDRLLALDGKPITRAAEIQPLVAEKKSAPMEITVLRGGKEMKFSMIAQKSVPASIGITMAVYDHPTPWEQFTNTLDMSWRSLRGIAMGIGKKLGWTDNGSTLKPSHMSGPLGIGMALFNTVRISPVSGIYLMVVISFALAIFNLLPLPVLDGGHIFFGFLEWIFRRPVPVPVMKVLSAVFITLLIMLMLFVTFSDSRRLVRQFSQDQHTSGGHRHAPQNP